MRNSRRGYSKKWNHWEYKMKDAFEEMLILTGQDTSLPFISWAEGISNTNTGGIDYGWEEGFPMSIPKRLESRRKFKVNRLLWMCDTVTLGGVLTTWARSTRGHAHGQSLISLLWLNFWVRCSTLETRFEWGLLRVLPHSGKEGFIGQA